MSDEARRRLVPEGYRRLPEATAMTRETFAERSKRVATPPVLPEKAFATAAPIATTEAAVFVELKA